MIYNITKSIDFKQQPVVKISAYYKDNKVKMKGVIHAYSKNRGVFFCFIDGNDDLVKLNVIFQTDSISNKTDGKDLRLNPITVSRSRFDSEDMSKRVKNILNQHLKNKEKMKKSMINLNSDRMSYNYKKIKMYLEKLCQTLEIGEVSKGICLSTSLDDDEINFNAITYYQRLKKYAWTDDYQYTIIYLEPNRSNKLLLTTVKHGDRIDGIPFKIVFTNSRYTNETVKNSKYKALNNYYHEFKDKLKKELSSDNYELILDDYGINIKRKK